MNSKKLSLDSFRLVFHREPFGLCLKQSLGMLTKRPQKAKEALLNFIGLALLLPAIPLDIFRVLITSILPFTAHQISYVVHKRNTAAG